MKKNEYDISPDWKWELVIIFGCVAIYYLAGLLCLR